MTFSKTFDKSIKSCYLPQVLTPWKLGLAWMGSYMLKMMELRIGTLLKI